MKTRSERRKEESKNSVVELLSSDDEEDKKPAARKRPAKRSRKSVVSLLSDSDDEDGILTSPTKRLRFVSSDSNDYEPAARRGTRSHRAAAKSPSLHFSSNRRRAYATEYHADEQLARDLQESEEGNKIASLKSDEEFARKLALEDKAREAASKPRRGRKSFSRADAEFARQLQEGEDKEARQLQEEREKKDAALAATLHTEETKERDERKQKELESMKESKAGRAVLLVERVIQVVEKHASAGVEPVGKDDAVYLAEKMLVRQEDFKKEGRPNQVVVGYHYTGSANLEAIRTDGLLTVDDRIAAKHKNTRNIAVFGNGIYTGNNPIAFIAYGDIGLLIAVLKGKEKNLGINRAPLDLTTDINTVVGNKTGDVPYHDEIILKSSAQVLPLVKFPMRDIYKPAFADKVWAIHQDIQHQVLDEFFNESVPTTTYRITAGTRLPPPGAAIVGRVAPSTLGSVSAALASLTNPSSTAGLYGGAPAPAPFPGTLTISSMGLAAAASTGLGFGAPPAVGTTTSVAPAISLGATAAQTVFLPPRATRGLVIRGRYSRKAAPPAPPRAPANTGRVKRGRSTRIAAPPASAAAESLPSAIGISVATPALDLSGSQITYTAPNKLAAPSANSFERVTAGSGDCSICMCPLADGYNQVVKLPGCNHQFHQECIENALKHSSKCPDCRNPIMGMLAGKGPSGTMSIITSPADVSGFRGQGSITITYVLSGGVQKSYHQNPGVRYSGTSRIGYLPHNKQGQDLLKRLKFVFAHGLSFSIGTSLTTHAPNVIVWGSVHHKTSMSGGVHGFPDPNYFANANAELDGLGIPPASSI